MFTAEEVDRRDPEDLLRCVLQTRKLLLVLIMFRPGLVRVVSHFYAHVVTLVLVSGQSTIYL